MSPRCLQRIQEWDGGKHPRMPMTYGYRKDFPDSRWTFEDTRSTLGAHLKAIDRGFEVLYDFTCAKDKMSPAHFLYRCIRRGGSPADDYFVLEFALQYDLSKGWPNGKPRAPGNWLLKDIADRDKARMQGDQEAIEKECSDRRVAAAEKKYREDDKERAEADQHLAKELEPYAKRGRKLRSIHGGERRGGVRQKGRVITATVPEIPTS